MDRVDKMSLEDRQRIYKDHYNGLKQRKQQLETSKTSRTQEFQTLKDRKTQQVDDALRSQKTFNNIFDGINTRAKKVGTVVGGPMLVKGIHALNDVIKKGLGPAQVDEEQELKDLERDKKGHQQYLSNQERAIQDTQNEMDSIVNRNPGFSWE